MRAAAILALALVALALLPATAPAAKRTVPHGFYGSIWSDPIADAPPEVRNAAWDRLALAGVESVRTLFHWGHAQPNRGPYNWERTDRVVIPATARGIRIVPTVMFAPTWAKRFPNVVQSPPARESEYAAFVAALVKRYGPKGSFWAEHPELPKRPIRHWQIWNEPTLTDHWWREKKWLPTEAKRYGALLRASARAARKEDSGAKIVIGGLTNLAWEALDELYRYAGIRGSFDVAAVHMFPGKWRNVKVIVERFRRVLDHRGGGKLPIWVTEMTWPAAHGKADVPPWANTPYYRNFVTTEKGSSSRLAAAYRLLGTRSFRTQNKLERVLWYSGVTSFSGNWIFDYSGLMGLSGSTLTNKPMYDAFRSAAVKAEGCKKTAAGRCR